MSVKIALRKTSLLDYQGRISSVFFFSGCNLRCPWCHNRDLVLGTAKDLIPLEDGLAYLRKRRSVLTGVVLSGGEPCLYDGLPLLIGEIKKLAIPVKLDTNGTLPIILDRLFSREETSPDYIALDLKIAPQRYVELLAGGRPPAGKNTASFRAGDDLIQSAALIRGSGIAHEFRSLALPGGFFTAEDIEALAPLAGGHRNGDMAPWYFRPFRGGNCLDPAWDSLEESGTAAESRCQALAHMAGEMRKAK